MGGIWLTDLDEYVRAEGLACSVADGAATRSRSSGGFDRLLGVAVHHDASAVSSTLPGVEAWSIRNSPDRPVGNGTLARDGSVRVWAMGAANTMGVGGPWLTARGVVPKDNGNRNLVAWEAMNDGLGQPWTPEQQHAYPRLVVATLRCINAHTPNEAPLGAGDVLSHQEWAPGRKIDPAGPAQWAPRPDGGTWIMDRFRQSVLELLGGGWTPPPATTPSGVPAPTIKRGTSGPSAAALIDVLKFWHWYPAQYLDDTNDGRIGDRGDAGIRAMQEALGLEVDGVYGPVSSAALAKFVADMAALANTPSPPPPPPPAPAPTDPPPAPAPDGRPVDGLNPCSFYVVQPGDSPWRVAEMIWPTGANRYAEVQADNPGTWRPGQLVAVRDTPSIVETVQPGDSPWSLIQRAIDAGMHDGKVPEILPAFYALNGGEGRVLRPGDVVCIPVFWRVS